MNENNNNLNNNYENIKNQKRNKIFYNISFTNIKIKGMQIIT